MMESTIKITKLTASDGYVLTNGQVYGREVYLGKNDQVGNWHEITEEEYDAMRIALEAEIIHKEDNYSD